MNISILDLKVAPLIKRTKKDSIQFNNRRISIAKFNDGNFGILFRRLIKEIEKEQQIKFGVTEIAIRYNIENKIIDTPIGLSAEGAEVLLYLLADKLGYELHKNQ